MDIEQQRRSQIRWAKYEWSPPEYCRKGHRLDAENLNVRPEVHKWECRTCEREKRRRLRTAERLEHERIAMAVARKDPRHQAVRRAQRLKRYGMTPEQYDALAESQGGRCALCKKVPEPRRMTANGAPWISLVVDHDHATGKVRGLLCRGCNQGMGLADLVGVDAIAAYQAQELVVLTVPADWPFAQSVLTS